MGYTEIVKTKTIRDLIDKFRVGDDCTYNIYIYLLMSTYFNVVTIYTNDQWL